MRLPVLVVLFATSLPAQFWCGTCGPKALGGTVRELQGDVRNIDLGRSEAVAARDGKELRKLLTERIRYWRDATGIARELTPKAREAVVEKLAKALEGQVDYAKEQIVLVRMSTTGPPFATLRHELATGAGKNKNENKDEKEIVFFAQAPALYGKPRGEAAPCLRFFFAVPAGYRVTMEKDERP